MGQVNELNRLGHHAFMKTVNIKGTGTWHRVYIERYDSQAKAAKEARIFKDLDLISEYGIDPIHENLGNSVHKTETRPKSIFLVGFSFQDEASAGENVRQLKTEDYKAFYIKKKAGEIEAYQVYIGEFTNKKLSRKAGYILIKKALIPYYKIIEIDGEVLKQGMK